MREITRFSLSYLTRYQRAFFLRPGKKFYRTPFFY